MERSRETTAPSPDPERVLVIMAKAPRAGAVKTRLAASVPASAVVALYCCLLDDTLTLARSLEDVEIAIMCPQCDAADLTSVAGAKVSIVCQKGEGLAAGLVSVFRHFAGDRSRPIIAFNSDSPHLPRSVLENAFDVLTTRDLVVGPTHDGGYYLVGAKTSNPTLFAHDGMGTSSALETLLSRAQDLRLSVGFVDVFYDIDVAEDMTRLAAELRFSPHRAPRTAMWLENWQHATKRSASPNDKP